ncbi:MAG: hypothetical protein HZA91_15845 [Verrucomicrobia bacterium]|nr:hypothetical protein [Verrucomicrobiota bacterium]
MPKNNDPSVSPDTILREMDSLGSKAGEAIDQLLAQKRAILESAHSKAAELDAQIQRLNELYKSSVGRYYIPPPKTEAEEAGEETRRTRRDRGELETYAKEIVAFIACSGPKGVSGADIKERFPEVKSGIRDFIEKYAGVQLRDNGGARAAMRYLPPA